jgi:hypothetical protein
LLVQHLEQLSGRVLEDYPESVNNLIRRQSGVYALYRRNKLYYVGLASNLMRRLKQHLKDRHRGSWDRFSVYLTARSEHMRELESLVLRIVGPTGNAVKGRLTASKDLIPVLHETMREFDADRRARILGGRFARRRRRSKTTGTRGTQVLAGLEERRRNLVGSRGGRTYQASLRRDGRIRYRGRLYGSPSAAARAALGIQRNGWSFWHFRDDRGKWVPLRTLKR